MSANTLEFVCHLKSYDALCTSHTLHDCQAKHSSHVVRFVLMHVVENSHIMSFKHHLMPATHALHWSLSHRLTVRIESHYYSTNGWSIKRAEPKSSQYRKICIAVARIGTYGYWLWHGRTYWVQCCLLKKMQSDKFFCVYYIGLLLLAVYADCLISASCIVMMTTTMMLTMPLFVDNTDSDSVDILMHRQDNVCSSIEPDDACKILEFTFPSFRQSLIPSTMIHKNIGTKYCPLTQREQSK